MYANKKFILYGIPNYCRADSVALENMKGLCTGENNLKSFLAPKNIDTQNVMASGLSPKLTKLESQR